MNNRWVSDDFTYSDFQNASMKVEGQFGGSRNLRLAGLDLSVLESKRFLNFGSGGTYYNLSENETRIDSDELVSPDYTSLDEIPEGEKFYSVFANQVFEHIPQENLYDVINSISLKMHPGGMIIGTIPNINNWSQYINNLDHKTPLSFYSLGSFFELSGIEVVDCYRYTKRPKEILEASDQEIVLFDFLSKYFEMDPAQFIAVVGKKRGES